MNAELDDRAARQPMIGQNPIESLDPEREGRLPHWNGGLPGSRADPHAVFPQRGGGQAFEEVCGECHRDTEHNNSSAPQRQ